MVFGKLIADGYQCEDCGATGDFRTVDCCDNCLLKFYFDNQHASSFADWREPATTDEVELTGYKNGMNEVLVAIAEFCGQGGSITPKNVEAWIKSYEVLNTEEQ